MKKGVFLVLSVLLLAFSCKDELKVNADWEDVSVIYGVLDKTSNELTINVERSEKSTNT